MLDSFFLETLDKTVAQRKRTVATTFAVVIVMWICLFSHLGALGLLGPDEPRYASIAQNMAKTGDWITPRLYGEPWFEKPVFYYWTAGVGYLLHFSDEWAARLPSAFGALAAALCIGWLALQFESTNDDTTDESEGSGPWSAALLAPIIFATSVAAIGFARAATPDMLFASSMALAMAAAAIVFRDAGALRGSVDRTTGIAVDDGKKNVAPLLLFGAFIGLGVLAKGPAAIILAGGAVLIWALASRRWRMAFRLLHPYAIAAFCVVALPWYVLCAVRNPSFLRVFILQHNFERYLTPMFHHRQPFWFFIPITLLAILPWTILLIPAARDGLRLWREKSWHDSPGFFFACWAIFPIIFFSFSDSKLPSYILPAIPAIALLLAISLSRLIGKRSALSSAIFVALGLTWIGFAAGGLVWLHHLPGNTAVPLDHAPLANPGASANIPIILCVVLAAAAGIAIIAFSSSRRRTAIWVSLLLVCVLIEIAGTSILPDLDPYYSARTVGTMLRHDLYPGRLFTYQLPRSWQYGLNFYLGRDLQHWSANDDDAALVLTTAQGLAELERDGYVQGAINEPYQEIVFVPIPARAQTTPSRPKLKK